MSTPFPTTRTEMAARTTTDVVLEVSHHAPPTLPFELKDHVTPNTWAARMSTLVQLASHYCRPTLERVCLLLTVILTLAVPITTYYTVLSKLEQTAHDSNGQAWLARFSALALTFGAWVVLSVPMVIWKYLGKVRVMKLVDQWTRLDAATASPSSRAAPVWKASTPGLFRDVVVLTVTVPSAKKSNFDRDSCLPPYIAVGDVALPPYPESNMVRWSKDLGGGVQYGELPIYSD